ncbi:glycosyl hydrolase family 18 protein [Modestobacter sp. SYSU DS0875]
MTRRLIAVAAALAALTLLAVLLPGDSQPTAPRRGHPDFVAAAYLPLWDDRSWASVRSAVELGGVTEVSPTWATLQPGGRLEVTPPTPRMSSLLDRDDVLVVPTVQNHRDGEWQGQLVADVLGDPQLSAAHRQALVDAAREHGFDGIDIDYEDLPAPAGPLLVEFLAALREELHAHGLQLSVAVPAQAADPAPGTSAFDYRQLGTVTDQVRVMAYDHAWHGSEPGPVAPLEWVRSVARYAAATIPPEKVMLGLGTYGYDWAGGAGTALQATDAVALAERVGAEPWWDDHTATAGFDYRADGDEHTVWFEDARSLAVKQAVAVDAGLRGVAIWRLGGEDPQLWTAVGEATGRTTGS